MSQIHTLRLTDHSIDVILGALAIWDPDTEKENAHVARILAEAAGRDEPGWISEYLQENWHAGDQ